jgi:hypothetical protein
MVPLRKPMLPKFVAIALSVALALFPFKILDRFLLGSVPWQNAQLLPYKLNPAAAVGAGAAVALHTAAGDAWVVQAPLVHSSAAVPVLGTRVSDTTKFMPEVVDAAVALHTLPPTVQLTAPEQGAGTAQVAAVAAPQTPLVQANVAPPVVGAVVSASNALAPEAVAAGVALHVLPPTVQLNGLAAQAAGPVHVAPVAAPQTPLVHAKLAAPVVGAVVSDNRAVAPEAVDTAVALHTLEPTLQLNAPVQGAAATGTAQVAEVAAPHVPLVQANVAAPVVGVIVSASTALAPDTVAAEVALQVLPPTVQLKAVAAQSTGAVQVAPVAAPHTPLVQLKLADPVVGAVISVDRAVAPEVVRATVALQTLAPTVQLVACAGQSASGAVIGLA